MSLFLETVFLILTIAIIITSCSIDEISIDDAKTDIEAITFNVIYSWFVNSDKNSLQRLFADDFDIKFNNLSQNSMDLLLNIKTSMAISDADFITDIINIQYDESNIYDKGHYYFYNNKNQVIDGGKYEIIWRYSDLSPKYLIQSLEIKTWMTRENKNNLYFDEHEMGVFWVKFWDFLYDLNDENNEFMINNFLKMFSINFEFNFVDTKDIERILFGRKELIEWMKNYHFKGIFGKDRLLIHKNNNIKMYKISGWQSAFEADIVLMDRKTKNILKEERWRIIAGYDIINRKFYRFTQFYDDNLFNQEIKQIQKRFPFAKDIINKNEL